MVAVVVEARVQTQARARCSLSLFARPSRAHTPLTAHKQTMPAAAAKAVSGARPAAVDTHNEALPAPKAHAGLALLAAAPLLLPVDPNFNVVATAAAAVYVGCWRSAKAAGPAESMSRKVSKGFAGDEGGVRAPGTRLIPSLGPLSHARARVQWAVRCPRPHRASLCAFYLDRPNASWHSCNRRKLCLHRSVGARS